MENELTFEDKVRIYGPPKLVAVNSKFIDLCKDYLEFDAINGYHHFNGVPFIIDHLFDNKEPIYYPIFHHTPKPPQVNFDDLINNLKKLINETKSTS